MQLLKNYKANYLDLIYSNNNKILFDKCIDRAILLQDNLHKLYKYNRSALINNLQLYNINISLFVDEKIFSKYYNVYCLILSLEKDLMNAIKDLI